MDLFCPHCTRRVTVPDDKAGQVASCPLCAKQFMAPALAPTPAAPKPPAPPPTSPGSYGIGEPFVSPPITVPKSTSKLDPSPAAAPPSAPVPPGDYTRTLSFTLSDRWLSVVPVVCVVLIFVLSFFTWHSAPVSGLWGLAFSDMYWNFMTYTILMFLIVPITIAGYVLDLGIAPPPLQPLLPWKSLGIGLLLGLTFLLLLVDYVPLQFSALNPIAIAEKLAIRLHFLAMLASFGMFWLHLRKKNNLPLPRVEIRY